MVGAAGTEAAARELSKLAMIVLEAPAAVVIVDGVGEGIHMEAGDTAGHPIAKPGSLMQVLSDNGVALGSIAISARPGRPYGERDVRVLDRAGRSDVVRPAPARAVRRRADGAGGVGRCDRILVGRHLLG